MWDLRQFHISREKKASFDRIYGNGLMTNMKAFFCPTFTFRILVCRISRAIFFPAKCCNSSWNSTRFFKKKHFQIGVPIFVAGNNSKAIYGMSKLGLELWRRNLELAEKCPISYLTPFEKSVIESFLRQFLSKLS